jgi:phosphatidate phosphatase APP1
VVTVHPARLIRLAVCVRDVMGAEHRETALALFQLLLR